MTVPARYTLDGLIGRLEALKAKWGGSIEVYVLDRESGDQRLTEIEVREYRGGGPLVVVIS